MARSNFDVTSLASDIVTDLASMTQLMAPQTCKVNNVVKQFPCGSLVPMFWTSGDAC